MHPFVFIDSKYYLRLVFISLLLCFGIMAGMQWSEFGLINDEAPGGIISFELARDLETAQGIIASWREDHSMGYAGFNIGLDFHFLLTYPVVIGLVIVLIAGGFPEGNIFRKSGFLISWLVVLAALFDGIENISLMSLLTDSVNPLWPVIAYFCAIIKFSLVGLGIVYILVGGLAHGIMRAMTGE